MDFRCALRMLGKAYFLPEKKQRKHWRKRKGQMKVIIEYFDFKMLEHFEKEAAKSNEIDERLKHCPRETKYSTTKFYNFNNKRRGARKV